MMLCCLQIVQGKDRIEEYMHGRGTGRGEDLNKQRRNVWIGGGGGHSATAFPLKHKEL